MEKLIIATGNAHKVKEFESLLEGLDFEVVSAKVCGGMPDVDENGDTFAANAQIKAEALKSLAPADEWVMADDSGLEVDALDGAPGIYSARYAGADASDTDNVAKLLTALETVSGPERSARFRCVLCLVDPEGHISYYDGSCEGRIGKAVQGSEGFGYDPVFIPEGHKETFGQLGESVKSKLSHRARAVEDLRRVLGG